MYGASHRGWHILLNKWSSLCSLCCAQNAGCKAKPFPFSTREAQAGCAGEGRLVGRTLGFPSSCSPGLCRERLSAAGGCGILGGSLQASKAQPFLLKGSICSSLALWQRPPTKANKGSGLACTRSPQRPLQLFREEMFASPRLAPRGEAGCRAQRYESMSA